MWYTLCPFLKITLTGNSVITFTDKAVFFAKIGIIPTIKMTEQIHKYVLLCYVCCRCAVAIIGQFLYNDVQTEEIDLLGGLYLSRQLF